MKYIYAKIDLFYIGLLLTMIMGCTKESKDVHALLKLASKQNREYPDLYSSFILFGRCDSASVFITDTYELGKIHQKEYSTVNYEDFLVSILILGKSTDLCKFTTKKVKLNTDIQMKYKKVGVRGLLSDYFTSDRENVYLMKVGLQKDEEYTILYLLFINDYIGSFGDYLGKYIVQPVSNILEDN